MLILHTNSLNQYGINRIFEFAKAAGYEGIEVGVDKKNFDTQNAEYLKRLSDECGLPIVALETPSAASPKSVEHVISMAEYLGAAQVVISPPKLLDFKFINWLKKEIPILRKKKSTNIALKNASGKTWLGFLPAQAMNNISDLKEFKMVALDTSLTVSKRVELMRVYESLKKCIVHIHLSNVRRHKEYALPMEGILPLESLLKKLKENKYEGAVSLLVRPSELDAGDDEKVVRKLIKVREFYEEYFGK